MTDAEYWISELVKITEARLMRDYPGEYNVFKELSEDKKRDYVRTNWPKLVIRVDDKVLEDLNKQIHPLMAGTFTQEGMSEIVSDFLPLFDAAIKNESGYHVLMTELSINTPDKSIADRVRLYLHSYLEMYESMFSAQVDFLVLLMIRNDKRFYRFTHGKRKFKDLARLSDVTNEPMGHKLYFLRNEGLSSIADACDRDLRIAVAHSKYQVSNDGILTYYSKSGRKQVALNIQTLDELHRRLVLASAYVNKSMQSFYAPRLNQLLMALPEPERDLAAKDLRTVMGDPPPGES